VQRAKPVVETFPGWKEKLGEARRYDDLPPAARAFVDEICERVGVPWELISVGPAREATIVRDPA